MRIVSVAGLAGLVVLSACVPKAEAPAPVPAAPVPVPVRTAPPPPLPAPSSDWRDWTLTPGTWRYAADGGGSRATYGGSTPVLTLACEAAGRTIRLTRLGASAGPLTIRTSTTLRSLPAQPIAGGVAATLPASDRLLDAMGFSRGRFVVETPGSAPLVVPAWAEVLRVVEDCRG